MKNELPLMVSIVSVILIGLCLALYAERIYDKKPICDRLESELTVNQIKTCLLQK